MFLLSSVFLFLSTTFFTHGTNNFNDPIANTVYGAVEGSFETLIDGTKVNVFLGIPFAQPPVGQLRFEKPEPPTKWTTTLKAKTYPSACPPTARKFFAFIGQKIDEDCLYLNVIAPNKPSKSINGYPIVVWIHGGAFAFGSTKEYGHKALAERFATQGIIVVMIQYRTGPLGFASGGDGNFPGNYGLWDQMAALLFVKENAAAFGGDASRITVWGESAGGASVSALTLSSHTKNLFAQAIQNSGSQYAEWAHSNKTIVFTQAFAEHFNCNTGNVVLLKACFKRLSLNELWDAGDMLSEPIGIGFNLFSPRPDGDFFEASLETLLQNASPKPTLIGIAEEEFLLFTLFEGYIKMLPEFSEQKFIEIVEKFLPSQFFGAKITEVRNKIVQHYLNVEPSTKKDNLFYFEKFIQLSSDVLFNIPVLTELEAKSQAQWPVYTYFTAYSNRNLFPDNFPFNKATHAYELPYIFDRYLFRAYNATVADVEFGRILSETMTAFIKIGNPSIKGVQWQSTTRNLEYLELKPFATEMKKGLLTASIKFWKKLEEEFEFNLIRGVQKVLLQTRDEL